MQLGVEMAVVYDEPRHDHRGDLTHGVRDAADSPYQWLTPSGERPANTVTTMINSAHRMTGN